MIVLVLESLRGGNRFQTGKIVFQPDFKFIAYLKKKNADE